MCDEVAARAPVSFALLAVQTLNGVQLGILLFLIAAGLTLTFGVMDFVNLAHGVQYMVGAYLAAMSLRGRVGSGARSPSHCRPRSPSASPSNSWSSAGSTTATTSPRFSRPSASFCF
jgi:ABC-type branched-subunit amino acid transport system permease subunit